MNNKQKTVFYKILFSLIFFVTAIITGYFNITNSLKITNLCLISAYLIAGYSILFKTIKNIINLNLFDENFLMCMATLGAFYLNEHFEAVAIILLYQIGEFIQNLAISHSRNSISNLLELKTQFVNLKTENKTVKTKPELVELGSIIVVKPGEQIPIDGTVVSGISQLNISSITGEFEPIAAQPGDKVLSGYINLTNTLEIKINTVFQNSTANKMLKLIENAKQKRANSEKFITKFAKIYTPIVVLIALVMAIVPATFFNENWQLWLQNAIVLLSISCPCALVISIPLSFFGTIASTAKNAILIKASQTIEKISQAKTIVFDKTGTLTLGTFEIIEINPNNTNKNELINLLAVAESLTNHPIANAIKSKFPNLNVNTNQIENFEEIPGLGIKATTKNNDTIFAGNEQLMKKFKINHIKSNSDGTVIYVAKNQTYVGNVIVADKIKPEAKQTIQQLRELKFKKIHMLTGDKKTVANKISKFLNLNSTFAEQLPNEKVNKIEELKKSNPLIFIGDGINDSPALATANVGISMGKFSADITAHSADVVMVSNNLNKITDLVKISRKTMSIIKQNIIFSITIKVLILLTSILGKANIWLAILSDVGVSAIAIANSLRTIKFKKHF